MHDTDRIPVSAGALSSSNEHKYYFSCFYSRRTKGLEMGWTDSEELVSRELGEVLRQQRTHAKRSRAWGGEGDRKPGSAGSQRAGVQGRLGRR